MKTLTRQQTIDRLVENEISTVEAMIDNRDYTYLSDLFYEGFPGYSVMPNDSLIKEYEQQFDEGIEIKQ